MDLKETKLDEYITEHNFVGSFINCKSAWGLCVYRVAREEARYEHRDRGAWWRKGPASLMDLDQGLPKQLKCADGTLESVQSVFSLRWKRYRESYASLNKSKILEILMREGRSHLLSTFPLLRREIAQLWSFFFFFKCFAFRLCLSCFRKLSGEKTRNLDIVSEVALLATSLNPIQTYP